MRKKEKTEKTSNYNYDNEDLRTDECACILLHFFSFPFETKTLTSMKQNALEQKTKNFFKKRESE